MSDLEVERKVHWMSLKMEMTILSNRHEHIFNTFMKESETIQKRFKELLDEFKELEE